MDIGVTFSRFGDAGENLEQRALTRAVASDDANNLTTLHFKRNILQRPKRCRLRTRGCSIVTVTIHERLHGTKRSHRSVVQLLAQGFVHTKIRANAITLA